MADRATAKGAIATATAEHDTMATARQKAENTEYVAQLTAELTANAVTMEYEEEGLISDQRSMSTSSVGTECTTSASEPDESDNDFTTVNRDRKRKRASTSSNGSAATAQVHENKVQRAPKPPSEQTRCTVYIKGVGYNLAKSLELASVRSFKRAVN